MSGVVVSIMLWGALALLGKGTWSELMKGWVDINMGHYWKNTHYRLKWALDWRTVHLPVRTLNLQPELFLNSLAQSIFMC